MDVRYTEKEGRNHDRMEVEEMGEGE